MIIDNGIRVDLSQCSDLLYKRYSEKELKYIWQIFNKHKFTYQYDPFEESALDLSYLNKQPNALLPNQHDTGPQFSTAFVYPEVLNFGAFINSSLANEHYLPVLSADLPIFPFAVIGKGAFPEILTRGQYQCRGAPTALYFKEDSIHLFIPASRSRHWPKAIMLIL